MADKITLVFDREDREWTWAAECWGNDDLQERFDTLEQLARYYGPLYDSMGADVDMPGVVDDGLCGDCIDGCCHWGSAGPAPGEECGCERHEASVRAR